MYVGSSTSTTSPGSSSVCAINASACCEPVVTIGSSGVQSMRRSPQMRAIAAQSRGSPRVGPYCSATSRRSRITRAAISAICSAGNVSGLGTPPANEMMFGSLISLANARMAEGRKLRASREKKSVTHDSMLMNEARNQLSRAEEKIALISEITICSGAVMSASGVA